VRFVVLTKVKMVSAIGQFIVHCEGTYVPEESAAFILNHEDGGEVFNGSAGAYPHHMIDHNF